MGVLECARRDCENIMCDRYSPEYGYICDECFEELVEAGPVDIESFMGTRRKRPVPDIDWYSHYNEIFPDR